VEHRWFAATFYNQQSIVEAESKALGQCNSQWSECKIGARFWGPGKCVFVAYGSSLQFGRRRSGVRLGPTEAEAMDKCRTAFQSCHVFHTRCNPSI
jgi:hypothetical protein